MWLVTRYLIYNFTIEFVKVQCIPVFSFHHFFSKAMMDRDRKDELPKMQVEFIDVVCRPLYGSLSDSFPWIQPLLNGCLSNREKWIDLAEKVRLYINFI